MGTRINPHWLKRVGDLIAGKHPIDETRECAPATRWLVAQMSRQNIPFKIITVGAGVERVTTLADVCPFCKQKLP
jgi:hypothetical protein